MWEIFELKLVLNDVFLAHASNTRPEYPVGRWKMRETRRSGEGGVDENTNATSAGDH